ncbi:MAG: hypothetical protein KME16_04415 [Scytolyngbya sp. HA4215-MV1]|jgi:hypothetical protein|nr:hypothetical protein [Scytolyngbya sp. HA4215-MV1]
MASIHSDSVKVFRVDGMQNTPFINQNALKILSEQGIIVVDDIQDSHILVAQDHRKLLPYLFKYKKQKKYFIWTHEPRSNTHFSQEKKVLWGLPSIHIMNVYTGDIYINNFTVWGYCIDRALQPLNANNFNFRHKKVVALMSYYKGGKKNSLRKNGQELDLTQLRQEIALYGQEINRLDIYGRGWKEGVSLENSRLGQWRSRKQEILQNYHLNLSFENTNTAHYVTEKIWDSIKSYCLPIYYGHNNTIYETFPQNSFLDYSNFQHPQELFRWIDDLSVEEFVARLNLCIHVFNDFYEKGHTYWSALYIEMLQKTAKRLIDIAMAAH